MGMTMRVYEVDRRTGTAVRERVSLVVRQGSGNDAPLLSSAYPPCQCPRCLTRSTSR